MDLLIELPEASGLLTDDMAPLHSDGPDALAGARLFSIVRLPPAAGLAGEASDGDAGREAGGTESRIRFAGNTDGAMRVFEFTAVSGSVESIDASILELPRIYRVAEVSRVDNAVSGNANSRKRTLRAAAYRRVARQAEGSVPQPLDPNDKLAAMGFTPLSRLTTDTSIQETPPAAPEAELSEVDAATRFEEFGSYDDIPRIGDVGLDSHFFLEPAAFCYPPLYFEEINLERFGTTCAPRLQPGISGARFFVTVPALPYLMTVQRPRCCYYDMSPYQAGRPAPWHRELPPLKLSAATVEAAALAGMILLIP